MPIMHNNPPQIAKGKRKKEREREREKERRKYYNVMHQRYYNKLYE